MWNYGDRQGNGGDQSMHRHPHRQNGGGIMHHRQGRMHHDHHQLTGRGGSGGHGNSHPPVGRGQSHGVVGNRGQSSGGRQGAPRGGSKGGRR